MGAGRSGPCSPRALPSIWTGLGRWRSGACRCCWPSAGWPGGCPCPPRPARPPPPGSSGCSPAPHLAAHRLLWHHQQRLRHRRSLAGPGLHGGGLERPARGELVAWLALAQTASGLGLPPAGSRSAGPPPLDGAGHRHAAGGLWRALAASGSLLRPPPLWCLLCGAGLGELLPHHVIALDHLPDLRRAGALCAPDAGRRLHGGGYRPLGAARLHHASGDFAAAWQWQLGALVLMSLLVVRLNPRHYPGPWACPRSRPWLCRRQATNLPDPASTGLGARSTTPAKAGVVHQGAGRPGAQRPSSGARPALAAVCPGGFALAGRAFTCCPFAGSLCPPCPCLRGSSSRRPRDPAHWAARQSRDRRCAAAFALGRVPAAAALGLAT